MAREGIERMPDSTYTRLRKARRLAKERERAMLQRRNLGLMLRADLDATTRQQRAARQLRKERERLRKEPAPDPYLTLADVAARYRITLPEARRRVRAGELPSPIEDGRDQARFSRIGLDAWDAWQKSRARLSNRKFSLSALCALRASGRTGTHLPFHKPTPLTLNATPP